MKRFFSAVCLCGFLLAAGLFFFSPASEAGNNVLAELLSLPAPPPPNPLMTSSRGDRPEDFYNKSKPPKDDAPLDELLDYWQKQNATYERLGYNPKPSPETLRRLLKACEEHPEKFQDFLSVFPADANIAEKMKSFYDKDLGDNKLGEAWQRTVKQWLTYNSKFFVDKLIKKARAVHDQNDYVTNQEELLALAKVDWDSAKPILDNMLYNVSQPASVTLAKWAFYLHAIDAGDQGDIEKYRDQLKAVVEDKNALDGMRDLAFDALVKESDWEGRDDWYLTLLEDESLFDLRVNGQSYTGLTTMVLYAPPEKYSKKMLELLKSNSPAVRNAAVRNLAELVQKGDVEVIKGLLPWLQDAKWAKEASGERRALVNALKSVQIPESVPGLIAVLNEKTVGPRYSANSNAAMLANRPAYNAANSVTNMAGYEIGEAFPLRDLAIYALVTQKDARAVPALRAVLPQVDGYMREQVVRGILNSNGFPVAEQLNGIEVTLKAIEQAQEALRRSGLSNTRANTATIEDVPDEVYTASSIAANYAGTPAYHPSLLPRLLGGILMNETEVSEGLVLATVNRMEALEKTDPKMSNALRAVMEKWRGPAMNLVALKELKKGTISLQLVIRLLGQRKELRETQINEVMDARGGTPFAYGIAACLLEDNSDYETILSSGSTETRTAMLGCARMIRASLPLDKVAENLKSADKLLATAAERYLESEDSPAARQIILAHFPNTSRILGARTAFEVDGAEPTYSAEELAVLFSGATNAFAGLLSANDEPLISEEKRLRKELDDNKELLGVYAYHDNYIRIYADRVIFSWEEDVSRYWERALKKEEFESFRNYLVNENVDELPPFLSYCDYCEGVEFLMFGRAGGRRVYIRGDEEPKFKKDLDQIFAEMRTPPAKLHYWLEKYLPGLEIMYADENLQARTLWKNGDDFRLLIEDAPRRQQMQKEIERAYEGEGEGEGEDADIEDDSPRPVEGTKPVTWQERRQKVEREGFYWYKYADGKLSELVAQPPGVEYFPPIDGLPGTPVVGQWKARTPGFEIRADYEGLYKIVGGRSTKIKEDIYNKPLVTPNGRWVIVTKVSDGYEPGLVRINLLTGKEFKIDLPKYFRNEAVAYIPSLNKVLLFGGNYEYDGEGEDYEGAEEAENPETGKGNHYLLDADTGVLLNVSASEVRPLKQQTYRALQPAGTPDTFWAAIPDEDKKQTQFGTYNAKTLQFKNLLTIPQIQFGSMNTWVDEKEGKLYFVYEGHLLRLPLPQQTPKPAAP